MKYLIAPICIFLLITSGTVFAEESIQTTSPEVSYTVSSEHDEFKKTTHYIGTEIPPNEQDGERGGVTFHAIRSDRKKPYYYWILVTSSYYGGWRYYSSAYDSDGKNLHPETGSREVSVCNESGCWLYESLIIVVSRSYLQKHSATGLSIQISGGAKLTYTIPAEYVKAFLSSVKP